MKVASYTAIVLILIWTVLAVLQLWFDLLDADTFIKITLTFALVIVGSVIAAMIHREYVEEKTLKKDKYLD